MIWKYDITIPVEGYYKGKLKLTGKYKTEIETDSKAECGNNNEDLQHWQCNWKRCETRWNGDCNCKRDECHDQDEELANEKCRLGEIKIPNGVLPTGSEWEWEIQRAYVSGT